MAKALLHLPLNRSLAGQDRSGPITATGSGALRYLDGPVYSSEEAGTTNLVTNPSFENVADAFVDGWTRSRDTTTAVFGSASQKMVWNEAGSISPYVFFSTAQGTVKEGDVISVSMYVKSSRLFDSLWRLESSFRNSSGAIIGSSITQPNITLTTNWARISWTSAAAPAGSSYFATALRINNTNLVSGDTFWVDAVQIEKSATPTSYADGSLPGNHYWTGTAHASTSVRHRTQAAFMEEGTTNLLANPSAETNVTSNLSATSANSTVTQDGEKAFSGTKSAKVVTSGVGGDEGVYFTTPSSMGFTGSSRVFSGSMYLTGSGSVNVWQRIVYTDGTSLEGTRNLFILTNEWVRCVAPTVTADAAKTINYIMVMARTNGIQVITFWADAAQVEEKPHTTSYADGSLGAGYAWTGTAHASTSTRSVSQAYLDTNVGRVKPKAGSISVWFNRQNNSLGGRYLFYLGQYNNGDFLLFWMNNGIPYFYTKSGTNSVRQVTTGNTLGIGIWNHFIVHWDENEVGIQQNNGAIATVPRVDIITAENLGNPTFTVGYGSDAGSPNALMGSVHTFDRPLTTAERTALYETTNPATFETVNAAEVFITFGN